MPGYGQFCPIAIASEVLTERWTPLVVRELVCGSKRFNDLRRGVPLMSSSLLSKRLKTLERAGLVERVALGGGRGVEYHLTSAGKDLQPIIEAMGAWGMRWVRGDALRGEHLDASLLMWDMRRSIVVAALPERRVVTHFHLSGSSDGKQHFWMVIEGGEADLCLVDPGHQVDLEVVAHVSTMVDVWMGNQTFQAAMAEGDLAVDGPRALVRSFPSWFSLSVFAGIETS